MKNLLKLFLASVFVAILFFFSFYGSRSFMIELNANEKENVLKKIPENTNNISKELGDISQKQEPVQKQKKNQKVQSILKPNTDFDLSAKVKPYSAKFALLIGYNIHEDNVARLPEFSENDVAKMAEFLKNAAWKDRNIIVMTSAQKPFILQPTRENILAMVQLVAQKARSQDEIFVMISGIGGEGQYRQWFLPMGATGKKDEKWIALDEIQAILQKSAAQKIVLMNLTDRYVIHKTPSISAVQKKEGVQNAIVVEDIPNEPGSQIPTAQKPQQKPKPSQKPTQKVQKDRFTVLYSCSSGQAGRESEDHELDLFLACYLDAAQSLLQKGNKKPFSLTVPFTKAAEKMRLIPSKKPQIPEMIVVR